MRVARVWSDLGPLRVQSSFSCLFVFRFPIFGSLHFPFLLIVE